MDWRGSYLRAGLIGENKVNVCEGKSWLCLDELVVMVERGDFCLVAPLCSLNCGGEV